MFRRVVPRRFQLLLLIAGALTTLLLTTTKLDPWLHQGPSTAVLNHPYFSYNLTAEEPRDSHQECTIPRIHPLHPSVWRYLKNPRPINCRVRMPMLSFIDEWGYLRLNKTELENSGYVINGGRFTQTLKCFWRPVVRGNAEQPNDDYITFGDKKSLAFEGVPLPDVSTVKVECQNFAGFSIYETLHAHPCNVTSVHITSRRSYSKRPINVLIFGIDSMSRLSFIRLLPKTYRYLTETLSFDIFRGMNKVGDNTYPNLVAFLTGEKAYGPNLPEESKGYDDWPLIWRNYSDAGYITLWAEDFPNFGLFTYLAKGFRHPPTHHYLRPFWLAMQDSSTLKKSSHMCFGPTPKHKLQINYLRQFVHKYRNKTTAKKTDNRVPYFAFSFLAELSHEYMSQVGAADMDFMEFFKSFSEEGNLQDTFVMVMSDHGHRFDAIRSTEVGRIEERLPFFALHIPKYLIQENPELKNILNSNKGRLTTPYDSHATLVDLLQYVTRGEPLGSLQALSYGRSLFSLLPRNRTCTEAGIPPHYCICEPEIPISSDDPRVRASVRVLFHRLNNILRVVRQFCVELFPGAVKSAYLISGNTQDIIISTKSEQKIRVAVEAEPSKGIFEATIAVSAPDIPEKNGITPTIEATVLGDISRINKYGEQSSCIKHDILRKYCFCLQNLKGKKRTNG